MINNSINTNAFPATTAPINQLANWTYNLNTRGKRAAVQLTASAESVPDVFKPIAKVAAAPIATLLSAGTKTEFDHFNFTPELGGMSVPHLPLMLTLIMFYAFMVPARIDSELKRGDSLTPEELKTDGMVNQGIRQLVKLIYRSDSINDKDPKNPTKKTDLNTVDVRPVRDVILRDFLSISLFLFALDPAQQALRVKKQETGGLFSLNKNVKDPMLAIMDKAWNPSGEMKSWSYDKTNRLYQVDLNAPVGFAALFGGNTYNRQSAEILRRAVEPVNLYQQKPEFKQVADETIAHLSQLGANQQHLTNAFATYCSQHNLSKTDRIGVDETLMLRLLFDKLPSLKSVENVQQLTEATLKDDVTHAKEGIRTSIDTALKTAGLGGIDAVIQGKYSTEHHTFQTFSEHFQQAFQGSETERASYHKLTLLASNVGGMVDALTTQQMKANTTTGTSRFQQYGEVWNALQNLQDLLPQYHLLSRTEDLLASQAVNPPKQSFVDGLKGLFTHSIGALEGFSGLKNMTDVARKKGEAVGVKNWLGKVADTFNPTDVFKEYTRGIKAPVDWMTFMMVAGVIGFVPVAINQVYTDVEFKLKHAHDKNPPPLPEAEGLGDFDYLPSVPNPTIAQLNANTPNRFQTLAKQG
jgi:hypothetical protein